MIHRPRPVLHGRRNGSSLVLLRPELAARRRADAGARAAELVALLAAGVADVRVLIDPSLVASLLVVRVGALVVAIEHRLENELPAKRSRLRVAAKVLAPLFGFAVALRRHALLRGGVPRRRRATPELHGRRSHACRRRRAGGRVVLHPFGALAARCKNREGHQGEPHRCIIPLRVPLRHGACEQVGGSWSARTQGRAA